MTSAITMKRPNIAGRDAQPKASVPAATKGRCDHTKGVVMPSRVTGSLAAGCYVDSDVIHYCSQDRQSSMLPWLLDLYRPDFY
ncbi:hypothetical protein ACN27G_03430 [Plantactinospora sp. WMMB334]|uniref:hypothetical protein n=1 Tax=Plantactinospora sp. WMMB334 TaxID=3404119 RepID=UPI003B95412F